MLHARARVLFAPGRLHPHITDMTDKPKRPRDANQLAKSIVDIATGETADIVPEKAEGQRRGGLKGGKARAVKPSPEERTAIAKRAAKARWGS